MVSMLAIGPKVRGFKPGRGRRMFKSEIKPSAQYRRILRQIKNPFEVSTMVHIFDVMNHSV
jgi:hypothetical protein